MLWRRARVAPNGVDEAKFFITMGTSLLWSSGDSGGDTRRSMRERSERARGKKAKARRREEGREGMFVWSLLG